MCIWIDIFWSGKAKCKHTLIPDISFHRYSLGQIDRLGIDIPHISIIYESSASKTRRKYVAYQRLSATAGKQLKQTTSNLRSRN